MGGNCLPEYKANGCCEEKSDFCSFLDGKHRLSGTDFQTHTPYFLSPWCWESLTWWCFLSNANKILLSGLVLDDKDYLSGEGFQAVPNIFSFLPVLDGGGTYLAMLSKHYRAVTHSTPVLDKVSFTYLSMLSRHCQADSLLVSVLDSGIWLSLTILGTAKHTQISPLVLICENNSTWWCFFRHCQADSPFYLSYWLWVHWWGFLGTTKQICLSASVLFGGQHLLIMLSLHHQTHSSFCLSSWWQSSLTWLFLDTSKQTPFSDSIHDGESCLTGNTFRVLPSKCLFLPSPW